jgi:long-chain acyl-CoA synthetase
VRSVRRVETGLSDPRYQDRPLVEVCDSDGQPALTLSYRQIRAERDRLVDRLRSEVQRGAVVGLVAGNTPQWLVADLALLAGGFAEVPVPLAFSREQAASLLREATACVVDDLGARQLDEWGLSAGCQVVHVQLSHSPTATDTAPGVCTGTAPAPVPVQPSGDRVVKIIHTSGTTGTPKGVRIRRDGLQDLLESLLEVVPGGVFGRYLSLVPMSLLIEQVTGAYLPICTGGTLLLLPEDEPLLGTVGSRAEDALGWLRRARPTAAVLPPAVVSALDKAATAVTDGQVVQVLFEAPAAPFLMAGGAPVDAGALRRLARRGIDVYEGYGLSENTSVVTWNRPGDNVPGTVGRPLPHCEVGLGQGGELLVRSSSLFAGYTVEDPTSRPIDDCGWLHTGDRAAIDADGRVRILGRLKNMIITSHGRNVSPEWVEGQLRSCPQVRDCVVFGNGLEHLVALVLTDPGADPAVVRTRVVDFARDALAETDRPEQVVVLADEPQLRTRYFTITSRPLRELIYRELVWAQTEPHSHNEQETS